MKDYSQFPPDPTNPGWVKGWGVIRNAPWDFAGLFKTAEEAKTEQQKRGAAYEARLGSHKLGSDEFVWSSMDQPTAS